MPGTIDSGSDSPAEPQGSAAPGATSPAACRSAPARLIRASLLRRRARRLRCSRRGASADGPARSLFSSAARSAGRPPRRSPRRGFRRRPVRGPLARGAGPGARRRGRFRRAPPRAPGIRGGGTAPGAPRRGRPRRGRAVQAPRARAPGRGRPAGRGTPRASPPGAAQPEPVRGAGGDAVSAGCGSSGPVSPRCGQGLGLRRSWAGPCSRAGGGGGPAAWIRPRPAWTPCWVSRAPAARRRLLAAGRCTGARAPAWRVLPGPPWLFSASSTASVSAEARGPTLASMAARVRPTKSSRSPLGSTFVAATDTRPRYSRIIC